MTIYDDLLDRFQEMHAEVAKALVGLPPKAFDWSPAPEMNPIGVLVVHMLGAERYWMGVALGEPPERDREAEFRSRGLDAAALNAEIKAQDAYAQEALKRFTQKHLGALRLSPRDKKEFTVGWCLAHALEHTALHVGHVQITRQLWAQRNQ